MAKVAKRLGRWGRRLAAAGVVCAATTGIMVSPAGAQDGEIAIELNRLEQRDDSCRLTLVFTNRLGQPIETLEIETVLFDKERRVERFVVFKPRPLMPGKIRAQQFDLADLDCGRIGSVLVNDVTACEAGDLDEAGCLARIAPDSRAEVQLIMSADNGAPTKEAQ